MNANTATPIWLEMRTEYIDTNFDKFIDYLYTNKNKKSDSFYLSSIELLRKRVQEIISQIASSTLSSQDTILPDGEERDRLLLWVRLLGIYTLVEEPSRKHLVLRAFIYQLLLLIRVCPSGRTEELSTLALSLLVSDDLFSTGYSWSDIQNFYPEVLATKIVTYARIGGINYDEKWYEGNGCARIVKRTLQIMNLQDKESASKQQESISVCDGKVSIMSPQGDKLKQSQQSDITALSNFTKDYLKEMTPTNLHLGERNLKKYYPDKEKTIEIRITHITYDSISAITIDRDYTQLQGKIACRNILCLSLTDLIKSWKVGDEIPCRITSINAQGEAVFDVTEEIISYITTEHVKTNDTARGIATKVINEQHTMWLTELGVPMYTQWEQYEPGTVAYLIVTEVCSNGYIKCTLDTEAETNYFDPNPSKKNLLRCYCYEKVETTPEVDAPQIKRVEYAELRAAMMCLYLKQKWETEPIEKYRLLCTLQIMCKLVNDEISEGFVLFMTQYLCNIIYFAKNLYDNMFIPKASEMIVGDPAVVRRMGILNILRCYGHENMEDNLIEAMDNTDQVINRLAKVIQSCNRLEGVLSDAMRNAIKHELLKMLRIDDDSATDLEEEGGVYLGIENGHQEFKTSIIYPPDYQMQPAPEIQKMNVFRAVCAFLNSETGGVVYLGVNDLGVVTGLDSDLQYLKKNLDGYMRYITDEAKKEFGLGVLTFIDIQEMYEEKVVAISVKPCDYKVVELAGKAYIRTNAESREMTKSVRLRIEERRRTYDKHRAESVSTLQSAIFNQRQVIVHGYSSSHGGDMRDRNLEPFSFTNGMKYVWCYDLDDKKVKLFSVARISNVEILDKEWCSTQYHKEGYLDIFYMTGDKYFKVTLELDRMAYNLILEEYPESKYYLEYTHNDTWILNTDVCSIYGVGRFYIGLADHITILDAPELKQYATEYFRNHCK